MKLRESDVQWIVNSLGELGVMIHGQAFFLYKGGSLQYEDPANETDGPALMYRPVFKREFGECCHPINYADPTKVGTVSLSDSDEWRPLPEPPEVKP
jgi:hypothetical protein